MKTSVWTDVLIILVLTKFLVGLAARQVTSTSFIAFVFLALVGFLALRSPLNQKVLRPGLSIVAVGFFLIDISYSEGPQALGSFLLLLIIMLGLYCILSRIFSGFR